MSAKRGPELSILTTAIGSVPHPNIDSAIEYSFRHQLPFLPQLPMRNPWEFMIAQALEGLPGLSVTRDGLATLDVAVWRGRSPQFAEKLAREIESPAGPLAFEPSSAASSCWQPFLWELSERKHRRAKVQIAGPMTAQWSLKVSEPLKAETQTELSSQVYRLLTARGLAMVRRLRDEGVTPVIFLDEPGFYGFQRDNPRHRLGITELKLMVQTLKRAGAEVGVHCCSNTDWPSILGLGIDWLSIDCELSLGSLLGFGEDVRKFLGAGGRLSLGVIPTARPVLLNERLDVRDVLGRVIETFLKAWPAVEVADRDRWIQKALSDTLVTAACGLGLHSTEEAEAVLELLSEYRTVTEQSLDEKLAQ